MIEELDRGNRTARKDYQCFNCYHTIPKGTLHRYFVGEEGGSAYTIRSHLDCDKALLDFIADMPASDFWDGVPPLADEVKDSGEFEGWCREVRGHFPHVVCRLELTEQLADLRWQEYLRERGLPFEES